MEWFVYLLECTGKRIYCGIARDVEKRLQEHHSGTGARFTKAFPPQRILKVIEAETHSDALKLEHAIKKLSRTDKMRLVRGEIEMVWEYA